MSKFKSFLLLNFLFALLIFVVVGAMQASAFSDDFNDGDMVGWNISSGSWSAASYNLTAIAAGIINHTISGSTTYMSFDVYTINLGSSGGLVNYYYWGGSQRGFSLTPGNPTWTLGSVGFTISSISLNFNVHYQVNATIIEGNIRVIVTNLDTGVVVSDQTVVYTVYSITNISIQSNSLTYGKNYFDNIIAQTYTPGSTPVITSWGNSITNNQNTTIYIP